MSPRRLVGKCLTFLLNKSDLPFLNKGYAFFFFSHDGRVEVCVVFIIPKKKNYHAK